MRPESQLLLLSLQACRQRMEKLQYSLHKNALLFPLTTDSVEGWSEEQEDISEKSNRDKTLLMEKLGAIRSAEEFGTAAMLRNKFAHHYPEVTQTRIDRLNMLPAEAAHVLETFESIQHYLQAKKLI